MNVKLKRSIFLLAGLLAISFLYSVLSSVSPTTSKLTPTKGDHKISFDSPSKTIPKQIFTYWSSDDIPSFYLQCVKGWEKSNPEYSVIFLTPSSLGGKLNQSLPPNFHQIRPEWQADWIRLAVLHENGGFWIDASFVITRSLDWIGSLQEEKKAEVFMFYSEPFTKDAVHPIYENWLICAVKNSKVIDAWLKEFTRAFVNFGMRDEYLTDLEQTKGKTLYQNRLLQGINAQGYLKQHIALQVVLLDDSLASKVIGLSSQDQNFGPFAVLASQDWDYWKYAKRLYAVKWDGELPAMIKLRKFDRTILLFWMGRRRDWLGLVWDVAFTKEKMALGSLWHQLFILQ